MWEIKNSIWNPNPITKFFVVGLLGCTVLYSVGHYVEWAIVLIISAMYIVNGFQKEGIKNIIIFSVLFFIPSCKFLVQFPLVIQMMISLLYVLRLFYLPFSAGKFLMKTSDVGSIISSMDYLKIPNAISIPIAVMFRFFPSFVEERKHIKMAMKIRGIKTKNPIAYFEYVAVPLLIISSNIADDISRAAETKCIGNPKKKTRYITVRLQFIDVIYAFTMVAIVIGGWVC